MLRKVWVAGMLGEEYARICLGCSHAQKSHIRSDSAARERERRRGIEEPGVTNFVPFPVPLQRRQIA